MEEIDTSLLYFGSIATLPFSEFPSWVGYASKSVSRFSSCCDSWTTVLPSTNLHSFCWIHMDCIRICQHQMVAPSGGLLFCLLFSEWHCFLPMMIFLLMTVFQWFDLDFTVCLTWKPPCNEMSSADANRLSALTKSIHREERKYTKQKFSLKDEGSGTPVA